MAAFALSPFMAKGLYPELVFRTIFELWHMDANRAKREKADKPLSWTDSEWLVDGDACEEKPPMILNCEGHTAALFCVEAFGVAPPPDTGWIPRDEKETVRSGVSKEKDTAVEWYRNISAPEWIYHTAEDMYYHLPTSSLWERRTVECSDPKVGATNSYFRADAHALQVLARFAMTLDSGLMPLAFKAWVRFMRKKKDRHFGVPAPPASPGQKGVGRKGSKTPAAAPKAAASAEPGGEAAAGSPPAAAGLSIADLSRMAAAAEDNKPPAPINGDAAPKPVLNKATSMSMNTAIIGDASNAIAALKAARSTNFDSSWEDQAVDEAGRPLDEAGRPLDEDGRPMEGGHIPDAEVKAEEPVPSSAEDQPLASQEPSPRKGLFCLRCFRSSRKKPKIEEVALPTEAAAAGQSLAAAKTGGDQGKPPDAPATAAEKTASAAATAELAKNAEESQAAKTQVPVTIDSVDRHMRRLDAFMDLVAKNPVRLVDHIEKRRNGRTTSLGFIVA